MKPILFQTIKKSKYQELDEDTKKRKNFQIIDDETGEVSKSIGNLEVSGDTGTLPEASIADSGMLLGVNASGKWDKVAAPSGGGFKLFTYVEGSGNYCVTVNTKEEINEYYDLTGIVPILLVEELEGFITKMRVDMPVMVQTDSGRAYCIREHIDDGTYALTEATEGDPAEWQDYYRVETSRFFPD